MLKDILLYIHCNKKKKKRKENYICSWCDLNSRMGSCMILLFYCCSYWLEATQMHVLFTLILAFLILGNLVWYMLWKNLLHSLLFLSMSNTHKHGGASWGGEQPWPGRTARNTCNRLVLLMLGNKSSHPSLVSPSPPSMDLIGGGAYTHFEKT